MAEIRKVKIDKEFIVKIKGEVETDMTDEKIKWSLDTMDKELESIIREEIIEDSEISVEYVRHAKWVLIDECVNEGVYCSNCHKKIYRAEYANQKVKSNYCPNCGAKMDGDKFD